eukprot:maker-scaffold630_size122347-snap-gene-0.14 protein:Tk08030 transcript:maker-scaffold630_size122347-snap-gene-0.14-mRNA-1 annotation:"ig domain-containing protein"
MFSKVLCAFLASSIAVSLAANPTDGVGLAIGGYGGSISIELVTGGSICESSLPGAPTGSIEGWNAEYVNGDIWLCGGSDLNFRADCYSIPAGGGSWSKQSSLFKAREYAASFVMNDQMVIMGGYNDRAGWLDEVERYDPTNRTWEVLKDWTLPRKLFNFCAQPMDDTHVIIVGGNEYGEDYRDLVDILDTTTGIWETAEPLPFGRASHDCINYELNGDKGLLVSGGCTEACLNHVADTLFFSYSTRTWTPLQPLNRAKMGHKMTWVDGKVTAIGGYLESLLNDVETFDGTAWTVRPNTLKFGRWAFGLPDYLPNGNFAC